MGDLGGMSLPVLLSLLSIPTCVAEASTIFFSPMLILVTSRRSIYIPVSEVSPLLPSLPGLPVVLPTQYKPQLHVCGADLAILIWATQTLRPQGEIRSASRAGVSPVSPCLLPLSAV